jgi:hypothetical protein
MNWGTMSGVTTAVNMKTAVFYNVTCSLVQSYRRFGGNCCLLPPKRLELSVSL